MNNTQNNTPVSLATPVTKILAIGQLTEKAANTAEFLQVMTHEVPATVQLYLGGKIEQWWIKPDATGVVFILNLTDKDEAFELLEALPLGVAGMMKFDFIPLGPLTPLRLLLNNEVAA
jgi:hypothetical protein